MAAGLKLFMETERNDLRATGINCTTTSFDRAGFYPFNPFCFGWTEAIATLGCVTDPEKQKKNFGYEMQPVEGEQEGEYVMLNNEESQQLKEAVENQYQQEGDHFNACHVLESVLRRWRDRLDTSIAEGQDAKEFAELCMPGTFAETDAEKLAMKIVKFIKIDITKVPLPEMELSPEERYKVVSKKILTNTAVGECVKVTYTSAGEDDSSMDSGGAGADSSSISSEEIGVAVKMNSGNWRVIGGKEGLDVELPEEEFLNNDRFQIQRAFDSYSKQKERQRSQKIKRARQL